MLNTQKFTYDWLGKGAKVHIEISYFEKKLLPL